MAQIGTGTTLTAGTSAWTGEILKISIDGQERPSIKTSHMGTTGYDTFKPGSLVDPGKLDVEVAYAADTPPPITAAAETWTVQFPKVTGGSTNGHKTAGSGFITSKSVEIPLEERITSKISIKFSGTITETAEA